jgi:hypothetical protein
MPFNLFPTEGYPYGWEDLSQIIYYIDEIGTPGFIYGVKYEYANVTAYGGTVPLRLWVGETTQTEMGESWFPQDELFLVYDSTVTTTGGDGFIYIPFDEPYYYDGSQNLVLQHHATEGTFIPPMSDFIATSSEANVRCNLILNWHEIDLENLPIGTNSRTDYPYTTFVIEPATDIGVISGIVYDENNDPVNNAEISVVGTSVILNSGSDGSYTLPILSYGEHTLKVDKYGYDYSFETVNLSAPELTQDFYLELRPQIQVTGNIVGSNDNTVPLDDVYVLLEGYSNYPASSDPEGNFVLNNVWGNEFYKIIFELYGYEPYIDTIELLGIDFDLGTIIMQEEFIPAVNVNAEDNMSDVTLEWINPAESEKTTLINDNGYDAGGVTNEPYEEFWAGNIFENPGTITLTDADIFFTFDSGGIEDYVTVDILNAEAEIIATSEQFLTPWFDWVHLDLPNMTITGDFYIMVHWQDNEFQTHQLCYDSDPYTIMPNTAYLMFPNEDPITVSEYSGYTWIAYSFWVRAKVLDEDSKKGAKEVLSYNVYRGLADDISNVSQWDNVNSEPVLETNFTDESWPPVGVNNYIYAIEAIYTEADSEVTFSNSIYGGTTVSIYENEMEVNIFPNPVTDELVINSDRLIYSIQLLNAHGQIILKKQKINMKEYQVVTEDLIRGTYYLKIETSDGWINKKIIK